MCVCVCVCVFARVCLLSPIWPYGTPLTVACQAPLSIEFSRQVYWSELLFPSAGDLPNPGIKPASLASSIDRWVLYQLGHREAICKHKTLNHWAEGLQLTRCACVHSRFSWVWLFATLRTVAQQAPLSMGFSRQEYWSGLPCPPSGGLPDPGIKPVPPALQVDILPPFHLGSPTQYCKSTILQKIFDWVVLQSLS